MKKNILCLAAVVALMGASSAWATQPGNNGNGNGGCGVGQQTNGCGGTTTGTGGNTTGGAGGAGGNGTGVGIGVGVGIGQGGNGYGGAGGAGGQGGQGGKGGDGGNAAIVGSGNSSSTSKAEGGTATATGGASSSSSRAEGGQGGSADSKAVGTVTTTIVGGDTLVKEAAQAATAYAPAIPSVPTSCRLYISLGGAGSSTEKTASASGGIPIGNDQTCVSGAGVKFMAAVNDADKAAGRPLTFGVDDFLLLVCKVEGMKETKGCQPKATPRAQAILEGHRPETVKAYSSDPLIAARQMEADGQ